MSLRLLSFLCVLVLLPGALACGGDDDDPSSTRTIESASSGPDDDGEDLAPTSSLQLLRGLDLDQYFAAIDAVFETASADSTELQANLDAEAAAAESFAAEVEAVQRYLQGTIEVFTSAIGGMEVIEPPEAVAAPHGAFIQNASDAAALASELSTELDDTDTEEDASTLIQQFEADIDAYIATADENCTALEAVAIENNIEVDLSCEN